MLQDKGKNSSQWESSEKSLHKEPNLLSHLCHRHTDDVHPHQGLEVQGPSDRQRGWRIPECGNERLHPS
jgi:hypothetical protein